MSHKSHGASAAPRRIVVPTDFSACSEQALDYALTLAGRLRAEVLVCFCGTLPDYEVASLVDPGVRAATAVLLDQVRSAARHWETELAAVCERKRGTGVALSHRLLSGRTAEAISDYAREVGAEMIVIGSRSRPGVRHLLLGSTAERVLRLAPCPVLVVHPTGA